MWLQHGHKPRALFLLYHYLFHFENTWRNPCDRSKNQPIPCPVLPTSYLRKMFGKPVRESNPGGPGNLRCKMYPKNFRREIGKFLYPFQCRRYDARCCYMNFPILPKKIGFILDQGSSVEQMVMWLRCILGHPSRLISLLSCHTYNVAVSSNRRCPIRSCSLKSRRAERLGWEIS